jgi:hypothetical protein
MHSLSRIKFIRRLEQETLQQHASLGQMIRLCAPVGLCFGCKYVFGHAALEFTPTPIYELFHCLNLVFCAIFAHFVLNEKLQTCGEFTSVAGVVFGSAVAGYNGLVNVAGVSWLALAFNLSNGILAGAVVVLLRTTMIQSHGRFVRVTSLKMLLGASCIFPFALWIEQGALFHLTWHQIVWLSISLAAVLVYHCNLSLLCYLATDAPTVAIVEALRPVPAFILLVLLQQMTQKPLSFWIGSSVVLLSAVGYELSRKFSSETRDKAEGRSETTAVLRSCIVVD